MLQLATKGLNSPVFGNVDIKFFSDLDEALAYCRAQLAE
jgi:hypothetical protein